MFGKLLYPGIEDNIKWIEIGHKYVDLIYMEKNSDQWRA
jgi:hypothetical protein